jgi:transcriptional regulator GlxA family with amidase domain
MDTTDGSTLALRHSGVTFADNDFSEPSPTWFRPASELTASTAVVQTRARLQRGRGSPGLSSTAIRKVHAFLDSHIGENFTLADIAAAACISRFHFARMFRLSLGKSPMEYALGLRIAQAQKMLIEPDVKISAIAAALGFCDQSHFTRSFRRVTGTSPRQYAQMHAARAQERA